MSDVTFNFRGFFNDASYGPDYEGQYFRDRAHAEETLAAAYNSGGYTPVERVNPDGETTADLMPCVSAEAIISLYGVEPVTDATLRERAANPYYFETFELNDPDFIVVIKSRKSEEDLFLSEFVGMALTPSDYMDQNSDDDGDRDENGEPPHKGHRSQFSGSWYCDTCNSSYCELA